MPRWLNAPNLLTLLRLALVPFIIQAILDGNHWTTITLFAAAAFTDVLDGAAARRYGFVTQTGAYLDPIADKCLMSGVFLALAASGRAPWWLVLLIFGRDIYLLAGALLLMRFTPGRKFTPSVWGKASTFVQILTAVSWMARDVLKNKAVEVFSTVMVWPCAAFTVWSAVHYSWRAFQPQAPIDAVSARE